MGTLAQFPDGSTPPTHWGGVRGHRHTEPPLVYTDTALWGAQQQESGLLHLQLLKQTEDNKASHELPRLHF